MRWTGKETAMRCHGELTFVSGVLTGGIIVYCMVPGTSNVILFWLVAMGCVLLPYID